jgi:hypothetical protein
MDTAIASETLKHLGGNLARVMVGATRTTDVVALEDGVKLTIRGTHRGNRLIVRLDRATDLYTVQVWKVRGVKAHQCSEVSHIGAEELRRACEIETGLRFSL